MFKNVTSSTVGTDRPTPHVKDDEVDDASFDSFLASDPPGWSGLRIGPPSHGEPVPVSPLVDAKGRSSAP